MTQSLGGRSGVSFTVKNTGTLLISRGRCVAAKLNAAVLERLGDEYIAEGESFDSAGAGAVHILGVAHEPIAVGDVGIVVSRGIVLCETNGSVLNLDTVSVGLVEDTHDGRIIDAAAQTVFGVSIHADLVEWTETDFGTGTETYAICNVNFAPGATETLTT